MKNTQEIKDFEELLSSGGNSDIKYVIDTNMESSVKYDYLVETYGKEIVDSVVDKKENLFDCDYYSSVIAILEK
jgi:hypothetical protein